MFLTLALFAALTGADPTPPVVEVWAGHQVLKGKRKLPMWGEKPTQTENFFLAEVIRQGSHLQIKQQLCRTEIQPVGSVSVRMNPSTVAGLPRAQFSMEMHEDGKVSAAPYRHGWENSDVDGDKFPGATVEISGTSCSGKIFISNQATTTITSAWITKDGVEGRVNVTQKQKNLGADGFCLRLMTGDSEEIQTGAFAYRKISAGTTCNSLQGKTWPIKASGAK